MPGLWEIRPGLKLWVKAAERRVLRGLALTRSWPGRYSLSRDGIPGVLRKRFLDFNEGSLRTEAPMSTKLKPQFFLERLALLEAREELFEDTHNNRIDADPFGLCPFF